ncbi:MAG: DUF6569 family protein [Candidatus Zixiibacteriota bacterium]
MQWKNAVGLGAAAAVLSMTGSCETGVAANQRILSGPYSFENLSVYLVHSEDATKVEDLRTLDEAVEEGWLTIFETGVIDEIEVENTSDWPVYIPSGSIVTGGRQDRMLPHDIIVAAHSGKIPLASFCIERGRWSGRGQESESIFMVAPFLVADRDILMAARIEKSQRRVWEGVAANIEEYGTHIRGGRADEWLWVSSLPEALENMQIQDRARPYVEAITSQARSRTGAIGMVVIIQGKISGADLYRSGTLFERLFPKLLDAAATVALAKSADEGAPEHVTVEEISAWMAGAETGNASSESGGGVVFLRRIESENAVFIESLSDTLTDHWIHKSFLGK